MFGFGMPELLVILAIVLVMFGAGRLPEIGGALGKSIRNFKKTSEGKDEIRINPADEVSCFFTPLRQEILTITGSVDLTVDRPP